MTTVCARLLTLALSDNLQSYYRASAPPKRLDWQLMSKLVFLVLAGSVLVIVASSASLAATDKVTSLADDGSSGTLRFVMASASPGDTIVFTVTGTITLTQGDLEINKTLIISGPGAANLTINGAGTFTVFQVDSGVAAVIGGVTIENGYAGASGGGGINNQGALALIRTTVSNNVQNADGANGEGIFNSGILTLLDSSVSDNFSSNDGAGIYNSGTLAVIRSTLSNNECGLPGASGGGIFNSSSGKLTVFSSTLSDNAVHDGGQGGGFFNGGSVNVIFSTISDNEDFFGRGAGIYNTGSLSMLDTTLSGNSAIEDFGGAMFNSGVATVRASTLTGNSATDGNWGGAIYNNAGTLTIVNSTLSGNSTDGGLGGGVYNGGGTVAMSFSTLTGNSASAGSAIYNKGTLTLKSTLLASQSSGGNCNDDGIGSASSGGYNLSDDSTCIFLTQTGDQNDSGTAGLSPSGLQNNGGPAQTVALLPTSSAVNAIPVNACTDTFGNSVTRDQRGVKRPQGSACDIGAYELATEKHGAEPL